MKKRYTLAIGICLLIIGLIAAPSQGIAAKAESVNLGIISYLTGPASPWGITDYRSIDMGADLINEQGGFTVKGKTYKWNTLSYDSKYIPAEAVKA
ncbi:MAG: hypothetical protein RBS82_07135, partial [Syntrophales bacterium]|nr:hypothetical protein [Syntrophales bacterium]